MSYPANKLTYGKLIVDSPMIFVRDPAIQGNFIETPLEAGTLRVNSATQWGFKYIADNLGKRKTILKVDKYIRLIFRTRYRWSYDGHN